MRILWDSGNIGFGGCGINEWDRNVIDALRKQNYDVTLIVDDLLSRRPKFKGWVPPKDGFTRHAGKITAENYQSIIREYGPFDVQVGNHFTMFPVLENIVPVCHDYEIPNRKDYSDGIRYSFSGLTTVAKGFACTTPFIEEQILGHHGNVRTRVIYGGSKFELTPWQPLENRYLAYWGNRYTKDKNFSSLLKTLPYHPLNLEVCGFQSPSKEELDLVDKLNLEHRVKFHVGLNDAELVKIISGASLFVCPSTYEGFGLPVIEAMTLGIPVIVAPCSALPSVVGDCGTIAKSHKTKDLAQAIIHVLEHPAETEFKRLRAVEKAKQWTWGTTAKSLTEFIGSVL